MTQNKHRNLKSGLVASYHLRAGNKVGRFSNEKKNTEVNKYGKK